MKNGLTELVFIIDRSGSMSGLEDDTIDGFNSMLRHQKTIDGKAVITTVLFDDQYELLHDRADIQEVDPMTRETYITRGSTALLDAIGKTIQKETEPQSMKDAFHNLKAVAGALKESADEMKDEFVMLFNAAKANGGKIPDVNEILREVLSEKNERAVQLLCGGFGKEVTTAKIFHNEKAIDIDCGCVFPGGKLGCLCLNTMEEFYV